MTETLTDFDRRLLDALQRGVPLMRRPYDALAGELHAPAEAIIARTAELSAPGGIVREIAGIFDASALGYQTTLVGAIVEPGRLDAAGEIVAAHPGVSHAYARGGQRKRSPIALQGDWRLNLWFTLAVGPDSRLGLDRTVDLLGRMMGAFSIHSFPTVRRYKLRVVFDMGEGGMVTSDRDASRERNDHAYGSTEETSPAGSEQSVGRAGGVGLPAAGLAQTAWAGKRRLPALPGKPPDLSDAQIRAIRALQTALPAIAEPFDLLARDAEMPVEELLACGNDFLSRGWMRRYAAVLRHRAAGAACNVMVVWQVPEARADELGARATDLAAVSHCYLRRTAPDWPWNLYTMIHGRDRPAIDRAIAAVDAGESLPRLELPTVKEYKKQKVRLFTPDIARWEATATE